MNENNKVSEHFQKHEITEWEHIPEHAERKETLEFRNAKKELEKIEHLGCFICGSIENRESHHIFERCWANAFDFRKVAFSLFHFFDFHGHNQRDFDSHQELIQYFTDNFNGRIVEYYEEDGTKGDILVCDEEALDTIYNQLILCKAHHRDEGHSAHGSTFATYIALFGATPKFQIAFSPKEYEQLAQLQHNTNYEKRD